MIGRTNGAFGRQVEKRLAWINDGDKSNKVVMREDYM
jgi:hypothetical protein